MPRANLDIQLLQPAIFTLQSGSAGIPQGLDYTPGATLLGHVAARLYAGLDAEQAWAVFHSGKVRFGDALPLHGDQPGYPMPLAWHVNKGESANADGRLLSTQVFDAAQVDQHEGRQPAQLRHGYVTADGHWLNPARQHTLKTAIDPDNGRAADGQLFGYETLAAGQTFRADISADDDIDGALWQTVLDALQGTARLGRSRSAQFGKVEMTARPADAVSAPDDAGEQLTLWLLADLALERAGQPCTQPHPDLLGLPEGSQWLPNASFLRQRSYSPYNAYRRHHDPQRQVISRGSVLRYRLPAALSAAQRQRLQQGLGLHVECGLGQAWVNPPLLAKPQPEFATAQAQAAPVVQRAAKGSLFTAALQARLQRMGGQPSEQRARELLGHYEYLVQQALRYDSAAVPPGRSQWGRLKQRASDLRQQPDKLATELFNKDNGILRERSGWELRFGTGNDETLGRWLQNALRDSDTPLPDIVGQLAALKLHDSPAATQAHTQGASA